MPKVYSNRMLNWFSTGCRLGFFVVAGLWLYFTEAFTERIVILFGVEAVAILLAIALVRSRYRNFYELSFTVLADMLFAFLLYMFTGPMHGNLGWVAVLPVITAALYFQWAGVVLTTTVSVILQGYLMYQAEPWAVFLGPLFILLVADMVFGALAVALVPYLVDDDRHRPGILTPRKRDNKHHEAQRHVFHMISELSSTLNYQRVLELALDLSISTLSQGYPPALKMRNAAFLYTDVKQNEFQLQISKQRGFRPQDTHLLLPGTQGLLGRTIETGTAEISKQISQDPELSRLIGLRECRSAYCIPLRAGQDTYGVLLFSHPEGGFFSEERLEILDIVGNQVMIALQNARLYQDLAQEKERLADIEEESRKKLARDLHDGPTQSIAAIAMRVNFARRLIERDAKAASDELFKIEEMARRTTKEIRHMLFTLRPLVLETQGLIAALDSMAVKMGETYNQQMIVQADQRVVDELEPTAQAVIFYIVDEAVSNARKHAQAEHIWVRLKLLREGLGLLEIEDDGAGFDLNRIDESYETSGSMGIVNMRERSELIGGVIKIESTVGRGTHVQVILPLTEDALVRLRQGL